MRALHDVYKLPVYLSVIGFALALCFSTAANAQTAPTNPEQIWNDEIGEIFGRLPIQDQARVKPLSTYAMFKLVHLSGRTRVRLENGDRLSPTRWLFDTIFFPEVAATYPIIRIENAAVMQAVGLPDQHKRTYFSLHQLRHVQNDLFNLARSYSQIDPDERTLQQEQTLGLWGKFSDFDRLSLALQFAYVPLDINPDGPLAAEFKEIYPQLPLPSRFTHWTAMLPQLLALQADRFAKVDTGSPKLSDAANAELDELLGMYEQVADVSTSLGIFPPITTSEDKQWYTIRDIAGKSAAGGGLMTVELDMVSRLETLPALMGSPQQFSTALEGLVEVVTSAAHERGEASKFGLELFFYKLKPFRWSLVLYILAFLVVAGTWLAPRNEKLNKAAMMAMLPPTALLIFGIVIRCILRGRPPVSTLYETTLFIPAVAIVGGLGMEWVSRKRIAIAMASVLGVIGLFLANIFELKDGTDTMGQLDAVLNSNFWLSTHVVTVTIGYSAGLLAAALAHVYIFARVFRLSGDKAFFRNIARMVYGVVCFGLILSFVGTVLGGVWANYSWGRFWGWDPKENGALLIVIWNAIMLHGRMGGYLRDLGMCVAAVFGGIVVAFSWWGVNLLGIGLHSYGFISGIFYWLMIFYAIEGVVILIGLYASRVEITARASTASRAGAVRGRAPRVRHQN